MAIVHQDGQSGPCTLSFTNRRRIAFQTSIPFVTVHVPLPTVCTSKGLEAEI